MAKEWAKKFYNSKAWRDCRERYIHSVHGLCERCYDKSIVKPGKILHHKIRLTQYNINIPDISLNYENLEYLCQDCHNEEHMSKNSPAVKAGFYFDNYGQLVQIPPKKN